MRRKEAHARTAARRGVGIDDGTGRVAALTLVEGLPLNRAGLPYLLAPPTASNIGSVATITGNPQNILIGSVAGIGYRNFLAHLGPVALFGLLIDWGSFLGHTSTTRRGTVPPRRRGYRQASPQRRLNFISSGRLW